ncbi:fibroblast growth factor 9-like [Ptychodera flava]|uniref:Fibroblast growth factor n=1 Tax=Ptychodera flava TaxID=63121 RepID=A0A0K1YXG2_PTYFL|nr:fibroblast growth factor B [Ptychodera flava]
MKSFTLIVIVAIFCPVDCLSLGDYSTVDLSDRHDVENHVNRFTDDADDDIVAIFNAINYRQFYCRTGFHLQIFPNGSIGGTPEDHNRHAILKLVMVQTPNIVALKGVDSGLYLAMDRHGQLNTSSILTRSCVFKEEQMADYYSRFSSVRHPSKRKRDPGTGEEKTMDDPWYIALDQKGLPTNAQMTKPEYKRVQFLPRAVDPEKVPYLYNFPVVQQLQEIRSRLTKNRL